MLSEKEKKYLKEEDKSKATIKNMFLAAMKYIQNKTDESFRKELEKLDYALSGEDILIPSSDYMPDIIAYVNTGSSEGIYVDVLIKYENGLTINVGTLKTLEDSLHYYGIMGALAGLLTFLCEMYYRLNVE